MGMHPGTVPLCSCCPIELLLVESALPAKAMTSQPEYTLLKKIADGGMAEIFLAMRKGAHGFEKQVVLKRIRPSLGTDQQFRNMLIDEAHIAMSMNHGNIVQVLDLREAGGRYFLALELVDGWSLDQLLKRAAQTNHPLPHALALHIVANVCRGLAYAHALKRDGKPLAIVHRDVSPQNVLISLQGEVKLTDFGIATALGKLEKTGTGVVKGKLQFMSPEQAHAAPLDARSDLFSLGTVLYMMATGQLPFNAPTPIETMSKIRAGVFTPVDQVDKDIHPELARVIHKAMRPEVKERYASADEMLVDLEAVQRSAFGPAGQTELKQWLAELSKKDGVPPISEVPGELPKEEEKPQEWIELSGSSIIPPTLPPRKVEPIPLSSLEAAHTLRPKPKKSSGGSFVFLVLFAFVGVGAGVLAFLRRPAPKPVAAAAPRAPDAAVAEVTAVTSGLSRAEEPATQFLPFPEPSEEGDVVEVDPADAGVFAGLSAPPLGGALDVDVDDEAPAADAGAKPGAPPKAAAAEPPKPTPKPPAPAPTPVKAAAAPAPKPAPKPAVAKVAPAPAPPRDDRVSVYVSSTPPGALVKVENRTLGRTPIPLRFRHGILFQLTFSKPGYQTTSKQIFVANRAGQKLQVTLRKTAPSVKKKR